MTFIHTNDWSWGKSVTISMHDGAAMVDLFFEDTDPHVCYLSGLSVVPEHRRKGYAKELLNYATAYCTARNIFRIDLRSKQEDFIMNMYHKLGFVDIKEEEGLMRMYKMLK